MRVPLKSLHSPMEQYRPPNQYVLPRFCPLTHQPFHVLAQPPALVNFTAIYTLTEAQATAYLNGYRVQVPPLLVDRKHAIRVEVGYTAEF